MPEYGSPHVLEAMQIDYFATWTRLFTADAMPKFAAAAVSVAAMWATLNFAKQRLALPAVMLSIPAIFHLVRLAMGVSLQEAADAFWCAQSEVSCACVPRQTEIAPPLEPGWPRLHWAACCQCQCKEG